MSTRTLYLLKLFIYIVEIMSDSIPIQTVRFLSSLKNRKRVLPPSSMMFNAFKFSPLLPEKKKKDRQERKNIMNH